jgi:hypothetical protein
VEGRGQQNARGFAKVLGRSCQEVCKEDQAAGLLVASLGTLAVDVLNALGHLRQEFRRVEAPEALLGHEGVFQITAVAFSTFLNRFAAEVPNRTAAKGDPTTLAVRRCFQCSFGNA